MRYAPRTRTPSVDCKNSGRAPRLRTEGPQASLWSCSHYGNTKDRNRSCAARAAQDFVSPSTIVPDPPKACPGTFTVNVLLLKLPPYERSGMLVEEKVRLAPD